VSYGSHNGTVRRLERLKHRSSSIANAANDGLKGGLPRAGPHRVAAEREPRLQRIRRFIPRTRSANASTVDRWNCSLVVTVNRSCFESRFRSLIIPHGVKLNLLHFFSDNPCGELPPRCFGTVRLNLHRPETTSDREAVRKCGSRLEVISFTTALYSVSERLCTIVPFRHRVFIPKSGSHSAR